MDAYIKEEIKNKRIKSNKGYVYWKIEENLSSQYTAKEIKEELKKMYIRIYKRIWDNENMFE